MAAAVLFIKSGPFRGTRWPVSGIFLIGRHPDNHLELAEPGVSRFHAVIEPTDEGFRILDLGSRNGTWVNGKRVTATLLKEGDEIRVEGTLMVFSRGSPIQEKSAETSPPLQVNQMVDLHCHVLPGLDDGPKTLDEAVEMCRIGLQDGIGTLVAVPHTLNGVYENDAETILAAVQNLKTRLRSSGLDVEIIPGADVHVNPDILQMILDGRVATLNHPGRAMMLEFPEHFIPEVMCGFLESLIQGGIIPVISHPERIPQLSDFAMLREMAQTGALFQITAMSLTGNFGAGPRGLARAMLKEGLVHVIASDAHSVRHRPPVLSKGVAEAAKIVGHDLAASLVVDNPQAILRGERPGTPAGLTARDNQRPAAVRTSAATTSQQIDGRRADRVNANHQITFTARRGHASQADDIKPLTISVISNKGGVGKTHFSINLAYALAKSGARVLLIDGDLSNADISNKLGIVPEHHLLEFFNKEQTIEALVVQTEYDFDLICSTSGQFKLASLNYGQRRRFVRHFRKMSKRYHLAIFDLGGGIGRTVLDFALATDRTVIISTPQDIGSACACARAGFLRFKEIEEKLKARLADYTLQSVFSPMLVLNQVRHFEQGVKLFHLFEKEIQEKGGTQEPLFHVEPEYLGAIPYDRGSLLAAEVNRRPLLADYPYAKASQCIQHISARFCNPENPYDPTVSFRYPLRRFAAILSQRL